MPYNLSAYAMPPKGFATMDAMGPTGTGYSTAVPATIGGGQNAALSQAQIDAARNWVNQQYGADNPFKFDGTDFNGLTSPAAFENYRPMLTDLFGAGQAQGWGSDGLSQIFGYTPDQITGFRDQYLPDQYGSVPGYQNGTVDRASLAYATDQGWSNPDMLANYISDNGNRFGWQGGATGGYTEALRSPFGTVAGTDNGPGREGPGMFRSMRDQIRQRDGGPGGTMTAQVMPQPGPSGAIPPAYSMPSLNTGYTVSPYLSDQIKSIGNQISSQFNEQILPGIRSSAIGNGTFGGAKQGVAEGRAAGDAAQAFTDASTNLLASDYQAAQNRNMQEWLGKLGYQQGMRGIDLGFMNSDRQYDLGNKGLDLQRYGIDTNAALGWGGLQNQAQSIQNTWNLGNQQMDLSRLGMGSQLLGQSYMLPWYGLGQMGNLLGNAAGNNNSTTGSSNTGGGAWGALGGLLGGAQFANNMKWFG